MLPQPSMPRYSIKKRQREATRALTKRTTLLLPSLLPFYINQGQMFFCSGVPMMIGDLRKLLITIMVVMIVIVGSGARDLRPSYHGLEYQSQPPKGEKFPPEMKAFFGSSASSMAPPTSTSSNVALPKAMNSNDTSWWNRVGGDGGNGGRSGGDQARHVLLVASLVCGVTGVALLAASALIYFVKKNKSQTPSSRDISVNAAGSK